MTTRKVFKFFGNKECFINMGNRTYKSVHSRDKKSHLVYILFNKTLVIGKMDDAGDTVLLRMQSFKDISTLVSFVNGDLFVGQKMLEKSKR